MITDSKINANPQVVSSMRTLYKTFYECLYNYSHKKLEKLIGFKEFCILFCDFYNSKKFEEIKNTDSTLRKHHDIYERAASDLVSNLKFWKN